MKVFKRITSICLALLLIISISQPVEAAKKKSKAISYSGSCVISAGDTVTFTGNMSSLPSSEDGMVYLFELATYEYGIPAERTAVASLPLSQNPTFTIPFTGGDFGTRLYSKFVMSVRQNGTYVMLGEPQYITNPEALAKYTKPKGNHARKELQGNQFLNLFMTGNPTYPAGGYLPRTVQLMNTGSNQTITNPYGRADMVATDSHPMTPSFYMLNANDPVGVAAIAKEAAFYAANSSAENYIVGNEVNVRFWNYMTWVDWDTYVRQYMQSFRIIYNAIKSQNANAEVFICLDCQWDRNRPKSHPEYYEYMDGKDFMATFNNMIRAGGNIDWSVANHPHTCPLTYAKFWDMSGQPDGGYYASMISGNKMVSFQNLSVITNYMQSPELLAPDGSVRKFIISELGLTNAQGEEVQAAALAASYAAVERNPYVQEVIYANYTAPTVDYAFSGKALDVFMNMDGANHDAYMDWAKAYIGISDWGQVLR